MSDATSKLGRLAWYQALFTLATGAVGAALAPHLLLLSGAASRHGSSALALGVGAGGLFALSYTWWRIRCYRCLVRSLVLGADSVEARELGLLNREPTRLVLAWLAFSLVGLAVFAAFSAPPTLDRSTSFSLCLMGAAIVATASLPLLVMLRTVVVRIVELAPPDAMHWLIQQADDRLGPDRDHTTLRLLTAMVAPVLFVVLGAALIVNTHLRRADERDRQESARALARAALDRLPTGRGEAGLERALLRAGELGFDARLLSRPASYHFERPRSGSVKLVTPLDTGSAEVTFRGSTVSVLSLELLLAALGAMLVAAAVGAWVGRALNRDLFNATHRVQVLGTDTVLSGGLAFAQPAQFRVVAQLGTAIETLAERFRVFAEAQARSIGAREAAARMRGLFLASVSHDLKSPLNAILGFTGLVRQREAVTAGQAESLELIERRGRELLALIETILDAARVEAGQLTLVLDYQPLEQLLNAAVEKGKDLASDHPVEVVCELADPELELCVDLVRMPRALASFIGQAIRTAERPVVQIRARRDLRGTIVIEIEVPSRSRSARQLEGMLDPGRQPGSGEHRGHALGMRLSRSIIELHRGRVQVVEQSDGYPVVRISLPEGAAAPGS